MGWWGMEPWDGDTFGDWWYGLASKLEPQLTKIFKDAETEAPVRWRPDYSAIYAACGIVLKLVEAGMPVEKEIWKRTVAGIDLVAKNADEMGWRDASEFKKVVAKIRRRIHALNDNPDLPLGHIGQGLEERPRRRARRNPLPLDRYAVVDTNTGKVKGHVEGTWMGDAQNKAVATHGAEVIVFVETPTRPTRVGQLHWSSGG